MEKNLLAKLLRHQYIHSACSVKLFFRKCPIFLLYFDIFI